MKYEVIVANATFAFEVIDIQTAVVTNKISEVEDQFFFDLILGNDNGAAEIPDTWVLWSTEGQYFWGSVFASSKFCGDVDDFFFN